MTATSFLGNLRLVKSLRKFLRDLISMEVLHDLYLLIAPDARATSHYPTTSQRFQLAARVG